MKLKNTIVTSTIVTITLIIILLNSYSAIIPSAQTGGDELASVTTYIGEYCYQETANVSTACGGLATGGYECQGNFQPAFPCENAYDENYVTFAFSNTTQNTSILINYTIPTNVINATLQTEDGSSTPNPYNITVPSICLQGTTLRLKVNLTRIDDVINGETYYFCYNTTNDWQLFRDAGSKGVFVEEAIFWNINTTIPGNDIPLGGLFSSTGVVFVIVMAGMLFIIIKFNKS